MDTRLQPWDSQRRQLRRSGWVHVVFCFGLAVVSAGGCRSPEGSTAANGAETTARVYELHCLGCHGASGEGAWGSNIQGLKSSVTTIAAVIGNGQGKMPAFKGHLTPEQMTALAEYVKAFKLGAQRAPAPTSGRPGR